MVFEADMTKYNFKHIVITSFQWCYHHYVTKITSQKCFQFGSPPN